MSESSVHKVATRTCVACGKSTAKQGLVRFVRNKEGKVSLDGTGRAAGRGAYVCANEECFEKTVKHRRLERALRCSLTPEVYEELARTFNDSCAAEEQLLQG